MKLYSNPLCPFAHRVKIGALERGVLERFEVVEVDLDAPPPELLAINPIGSVPTVAFAPGDGFNESLVLLEWLDSLEGPGRKLFGDTPREVGKTKVLMEHVHGRFLSTIQAVNYSRGNAVSLRKAVAGLPAAYEWLGTTLERLGTPFLGGATPGAPDASIAPFLVRFLLLREVRKELPLPKEGSPTAEYFKRLSLTPSVKSTSPTLEAMGPVFERYAKPEEGVRAVLEASRALLPNPEERCARLNETLASVKPRTIQPGDTTQEGGALAWRFERKEKGPQIRATFRIPSYVEMLLAIETLTALQETADHHTAFTLEGYHHLDVVLCTHEPQWGLSEKDFAMAHVLSEKLLRL